MVSQDRLSEIRVPRHTNQHFHAHHLRDGAQHAKETQFNKRLLGGLLDGLTGKGE